MDNSIATLRFPEAALRDEASVIEQIASERDLSRTTRQALLWGAAAAALFGVTLGTYDQSWIQVLSSAVKLPLLLFGSAALCFPTFHAVQVLRAPKALSLAQSLALQATALSSTAMVWAAFSLPLFFLIGTTRHYKLAQVLALAVGAAGGFVGLARLRAGYRRLCDPEHKRGSARALLHDSRGRRRAACLGAQAVHRLSHARLRALSGSRRQHFQAHSRNDGKLVREPLEQILLVPSRSPQRCLSLAEGAAGSTLRAGRRGREGR